MISVDGLLAPSWDDIVAAQARIREVLPPTPMLSYPAVDAAIGTETWIKHENLQRVGAFKVRGGVNLVAALPGSVRASGIIAASTGNHGLSLAYACSLFATRCVICVPTNPNPAKKSAIAALGAEVVEHGRDFDDARQHCEQLAVQEGMRYVHSGDEPDLIAGVATITVEMLEQVPDLDVLFVPIGGGSGVAGACLAAKAIRPQLRVIGVQSEASPAAYRSWRDHRLQQADSHTWAEGLATRSAFALPQAIMGELLDDFILVSDAQIRQGVADIIRWTRTVSEGAGAAALAGALQMKSGLAGAKVGVICSGGNLSTDQLRWVLSP